MREQIIQALGLPAEATDEEILAAVAGLSERLKQLEASAAEAEQARLAAAVENDLKEHAAKIENRDAVKAALLSNRAGTLAVLAAVKVPAPAAKAPPAAMALNTGREGGPDEGAKKLTGLDRTIAAFNAAKA